MSTPSLRQVADRCPGLLRPHQAADGALVRLRLPGGVIDAAAFGSVVAASQTYADGNIQITSRANLQLRGVRPEADGEAPAELVGELVDAGLLPSATHERVRNLLCSPLTGRVGGHADLRPVLREFDCVLRATPALADLPGRFLFGFDDGRGDVVGLGADLGVIARGPDTAALVVAGRAGGEVLLSQVPAVLVGLALEFLSRRGSQWRVRELPRSGEELTPLGTPLSASGELMPLGVLPQSDGLSCVATLVPLGLITAQFAGALTTVARTDLIVTTGRGIVVPDLPTADASAAAATLHQAGLVLDPTSAWRSVTACAGAPGCANAAADTVALATRVAALGPHRVPVHVTACGRGCGTPARGHVSVVAGPADVTIDGRRHAPDDLARGLARSTQENPVP